MEVKLGSIKLNVIDYIEENYEEGNTFITDSEIDAAQFNDFLSFYREYSVVGKYFETVFPDRSFYGRFGQLLYSQNDNVFKLRLVFVNAKCDQPTNKKSFNPVTFDSEYINLLNKTAKQDIIIENLKELLLSKFSFTDSEIEKVFTVDNDTLISKRIEIRGKVKDLDQYLKEDKSRLDDIRNS